MRRLVAGAAMVVLVAAGCEQRPRKPIVMQTSVEARPEVPGPQVFPSAVEPTDGGQASAAQARAIVDKAIRAHAGDAARLARLRHQTLTLQGKIFLPDGAADAVCRVTLRLPGFGRWTLDQSRGAAKLSVSFAVQGDVGWFSRGGTTEVMHPAQLADLRNDLQLQWVASLVPLTGPDASLTTVPNLAVGSKTLLGVKASIPGQSPVRLYFDQDSGLLMRAEFIGTIDGERAPKEFAYGDYRDFDGLKLPTHLIESHQGRLALEWTASDYAFPEKLEEKAFDRP